MTKNRVFAATLLMVLTAAILDATPQKTDSDFTTFWQRFKGAISSNDKTALASMTRLPFLYDSKERSREQFIKIYPQLFTPKIRRCLVRAKPMPEGENYDVFCGELIFYFGKDGGKYKLLEFGVND
jgi:hypothetical protein